MFTLSKCLQEKKFCVCLVKCILKTYINKSCYKKSMFEPVGIHFRIYLQLQVYHNSIKAISEQSMRGFFYLDVIAVKRF